LFSSNDECDWVLLLSLFLGLPLLLYLLKGEEFILLSGRHVHDVFGLQLTTGLLILLVLLARNGPVYVLLPLAHGLPQVRQVLLPDLRVVNLLLLQLVILEGEARSDCVKGETGVI